MKKILIILLSVMALTLAACGRTEHTGKQEADSNGESGRTTEQTEDVSEKEEESDLSGKEQGTETPVADEEQVGTEEEESRETQKTEEPAEQKESGGTTETSSQVAPGTTEAVAAATETTQASAGEQTTEQTTEYTPAGYNPGTVVSLAIAKCQAGGMITTQDHLANALAEGRITQEEYDAYYPYDGLDSSYYSVFVETDLNRAATTSGEPLRSEDAIAGYIADMLLLENSQVFNIVYAGVYTSNGTDYYEFRCLR